MGNRTNEELMRMAIRMSLENIERGGGPFAAIIVKNGEIVSTGINSVAEENDPTAHAEIIAIRQASEKLKSWRLEGATLYVTLEPCAMCIGAIVLARISRLVFGARDPKAGAVYSVYNIGTDDKLNHSVDVAEGVLEAECSGLLKNFFNILRGEST